MTDANCYGVSEKGTCRVHNVSVMIINQCQMSADCVDCNYSVLIERKGELGF